MRIKSEAGGGKKRERERERKKQKENTENFFVAPPRPDPVRRGANERREWKKMNKAWNKLRYLFVPRVRLPSLHPAQRAVTTTAPPTSTPLIPFLSYAREERDAVIFRGFFRAFLWRILDLDLDGIWKNPLERIYIYIYIYAYVCIYVSFHDWSSRILLSYWLLPLGNSSFACESAIHSTPEFPFLYASLVYVRGSKSFIVIIKSLNEREIEVRISLRFRPVALAELILWFQNKSFSSLFASMN